MSLVTLALCPPRGPLMKKGMTWTGRDARQPKFMG